MHSLKRDKAPDNEQPWPGPGRRRLRRGVEEVRVHRVRHHPEAAADAVGLDRVAQVLRDGRGQLGARERQAGEAQVAAGRKSAGEQTVVLADHDRQPENAPEHHAHGSEGEHVRVDDVGMETVGPEPPEAREQPGHQPELSERPVRGADSHGPDTTRRARRRARSSGTRSDPPARGRAQPRRDRR